MQSSQSQATVSDHMQSSITIQAHTYLYSLKHLHVQGDIYKSYSSQIHSFIPTVWHLVVVQRSKNYKPKAHTNSSTKSFVLSAGPYLLHSNGCLAWFKHSSTPEVCSVGYCSFVTILPYRENNSFKQMASLTSHTYKMMVAWISRQSFLDTRSL